MSAWWKGFLYGTIGVLGFLITLYILGGKVVFN
jgi:hypothetical protein